MKLKTTSILNQTKSNNSFAQVSENNSDITRNFIINNDFVMRDIDLSASFILYTSDNGITNPCAVFCFEQNDIRTKCSFPPDVEKRNYYELTYVLIDESLINKDALILTFRKIFPLIVSNNEIDEVIWTEYNGLHSRLIGKIFKSCKEYYFQNESEYFTNVIIEGYNHFKSKENHMNDLLNIT